MKSVLVIFVISASGLSWAAPNRTLHFSQPVTIDLTALRDRADRYLMAHYLVTLPRKGEFLLNQGRLIEKQSDIGKGEYACQVKIEIRNPLPQAVTFSGDYPVYQITYENRVGTGKEDYFLSRLEMTLNYQATTPAAGTLIGLEINRMGRPIGFPEKTALESCFGAAAELR